MKSPGRPGLTPSGLSGDFPSLFVCSALRAMHATEREVPPWPATLPNVARVCHVLAQAFPESPARFPYGLVVRLDVWGGGHVAWRDGATFGTVTFLATFSVLRS